VSRPSPHWPGPWRWAAWLLWALLGALALGVVGRASISTDITAFLPGPATRAQALLAEQLRDGVAARLMLIGIDLGAPTGDAAVDAAAVARAARLSRALATSLRTDPQFAYVQNGEAAALESELQALLAARYLISPQVDPKAFDVEGLRASFERLETLLRSAAAPLLNRIAARDPTGELLAVLTQLGGAGQGPPTRDGVWFTRDGRTALVLAQTRAAGFDIDGQAAAVQVVEAAFARAVADPAPVDAAAPAAASLQLAGPGVFAVQSRAAIERDAHRLSIIASVLIALLLLATLRSPRFLLLAALPVGSGVLAGLAAVAAGFGTIHGITLGFGVTLIGEAVDYAIYVQVQRRAGTADARLWRALWLAVLTSAASFVAMMLSGFQGLMQLGVFSLVGLVAAALVARVLLPAALPPLPAARLAAFGWLQTVARQAPRARMAVLALAAAALTVLAVRAPTMWNDELAAISPLARASGELDGRLRGDLGLPDLRFLVAVDAASLDAALAAAEALTAPLQTLRDAGAIAGHDSPVDLLPSTAVQRARQQALPAPDELRSRLASALADSNFIAGAFEPFIADVAAARDRAPLTLGDFAGTGLGQRLASQISVRDGGASVLVTLRGVSDAAALRAAVQAVPGAMLVDLRDDVQALIGSYRHRALLAAVGGLLLIVALLAWQVGDRRAVMRITLALVAAVAVTAAILVLTQGALTLFHLVALLLVVGVGTNYALFFGTLARDADESGATRVSVLLCAMSTFTAFALLATSATPVLHMIGLTVAIGALASFIASIVLAAPPAAPPAPASPSVRSHPPDPPA
jgi:predicted exporter